MYGHRTEMKTFIKRIALGLIRFLFGLKIVDQRTGQVVAKVVIVRWRGCLRIIGLGEAGVSPHFLPQDKETYCAQDLGFSTHPPPDFPRSTSVDGDKDCHFSNFAPEHVRCGTDGAQVTGTET